MPLDKPAPPRRGTSSRRRTTDWGRGIALALCLLFALIGIVPLALGLLVRAPSVRAWAAEETAKVIEQELGAVAEYDVEVQAWPLSVALTNVVVEASDGGSPFLSVDRAEVRPRLFSLLAGEFDVGDVEIIGPRLRAVIRDGELTNVDYKLPESDDDPKADQPSASLASISVTDAWIDADVDGVIIAARALDVDLTSELDNAFEVHVSAGTSTVTRRREMPGRVGLQDAVDDDVICELEARFRLQMHSAPLEGPKEAVIRYLDFSSVVDFDPDPKTPLPCNLPEDDWRRAELRARQMVVGLSDESPTLSGEVYLNAPTALAHRFVDIAHATGSVKLTAEIEYDGKSTLPRLSGELETRMLGLDGKVFSDHIVGGVSIQQDTVRLENVQAAWADGQFDISFVEVQPLKKQLPLYAGAIKISNVEFPGLLRDLGVHPQTHVAWTLQSGGLENFSGTLAPLDLSGPISLSTKDFGVYDRPAHRTDRQRMISVAQGSLAGEFAINDRAVVFRNFSVVTPQSHIYTTVTLGFDEHLGIEVTKGSVVDFADLSPLVSVPIGGRAEITASGTGPFELPKIEGDVMIEDFSIGDFKVGTVETARVAFEPLALSISGVSLRHGESVVVSDRTQIDFDAGADIVVDADVNANTEQGLSLRDFFEVFGFDGDPRFADLEAVARGNAAVHYALGGERDLCGTGFLDVAASSTFTQAKLFGEHYPQGSLDMRFIWDDPEAGDSAMRIDIQSLQLKKGTGSIVARASISDGAQLRGTAIATGIPLGSLDAFGALGSSVDGNVSMVGELGGTLGAMEGRFDIDSSSVRIGPGSLPPSRFSIALEPRKRAPPNLGKTQCGNPRAAVFDPSLWEQDLSDGVFRINGALFGGQVELDNVTITQQRSKLVAGKLRARKLDLGIIANLLPGVAYDRTPPTGSLSADLDLLRYPVDAPHRISARTTLHDFSLTKGPLTLLLSESTAPLSLEGDHLNIPKIALVAKTPSGLRVNFNTEGSVAHITSDPDVDVGVRVEPIDLAQLSADVDSLERVSGQVNAQVSMRGHPNALRYAGSAQLVNGAMVLRGSPLALSGMNVDVEVGNSEIRITKARADVGGGTITATGRLPVQGLTLGTATATITARGVRAPLADDVDLMADADLEATYQFGTSSLGESSLPDIRGKVSLLDFNYTRPVSMSVDIAQITGRNQRTEVDTYDPAADVLRFNVQITSPRALRFENNLMTMKLMVSDPGLNLTGTNQRFGARGRLRILPDSKLQLRRHEFEVREGYVEFSDLEKIAPEVELRAETEFRRYASSASASADAEGAGSTTSGDWRIHLHAHGSAENLKLDLTSEPPLAQEDIILLLTIGMTRAELDRSRASLGQSVGLEALTTLTGADKAITDAVPIIDHFHFGSSYSSRTGRNEPNVTVGRRLSENVRANVTKTVTESDVASALEWRLRRGVSVQGSYDNSNDANSEGIGNIGADLRWRLEFE